MTARTDELLWVTDHLDDLDADFRVFYRVDGVGDGQYGGLSAARFLALCERVTAYSGVLAARLAEQEQARADVRPELLARRAAGDRAVDGSRAALMADPVTAGLIDF